MSREWNKLYNKEVCCLYTSNQRQV